MTADRGAADRGGSTAGQRSRRSGHVAIRTCAGCGLKAPKGELVRLVLGRGGQAVRDPVQRAPGRGAYVHEGDDCLERATRRGGLSRAFRAPVSGVAQPARVG